MKTYRPSSPSHYRDQAAQERRRLEAAKLFKKGVSQADIARDVKVTPAAVSQWHSAWQKGGRKNLHSRGKTGSKPKLTDARLNTIQRVLLEGPRKSGYATDNLDARAHEGGHTEENAYPLWHHAYLENTHHTARLEQPEAGNQSTRTG